MISLWKTATDLERLNELQKVAIECYALAVSTTGQYAVEADPAHAAEFREHLEALGKKLREAPTPGSLQEVSASYRGELREYRDKAQKRFDQLRQDVQAAAEAMKSFADSVASSGADHEEQLDQELDGLRTLTKSDNLNEIRGGIRAATQCITASVETMRRSNQLVIAQLQDEIRLLHQEIQTERRSHFTDQGSGAWTRLKLESRIEELLRQDESFCLLLVAVRNLKQLDSGPSQTLVPGALTAVATRIQEILGEEAMVGRWSEGEFLAILPMEPSDVMALSQEATAKLSGTYAVQENGLTRSLSLQVTAGIVDRRPGNDLANLHKRLEQMAGALVKG